MAWVQTLMFVQTLVSPGVSVNLDRAVQHKPDVAPQNNVSSRIGIYLTPGLDKARLEQSKNNMDEKL
jgi:hypothetical protein